MYKTQHTATTDDKTANIALNRLTGELTEELVEDLLLAIIELPENTAVHPSVHRLSVSLSVFLVSGNHTFKPRVFTALHCIQGGLVTGKLSVRPSVRPTVCPSVCLSVCLSNVWLMAKRKKSFAHILIPHERSFTLVLWQEEWGLSTIAELLVFLHR